LQPSTCRAPTPDGDPTTQTDNDGAGGDSSEQTPIQPGNRIPLLTRSAPVGDRILEKFWAHENDTSPASSDLRCPFAHKIINAIARDRSKASGETMERPFAETKDITTKNVR
jgi:hypothetical protein